MRHARFLTAAVVVAGTLVPGQAGAQLWRTPTRRSMVCMSSRSGPGTRFGPPGREGGAAEPPARQPIAPLPQASREELSRPAGPQSARFACPL